MRTWGRIPDPAGGPIPVWVEVSTAPNGNNDRVWLTTMIQEIRLNLNESPFYADHGIPAEQAILQQIQPDYYVSRIQERYAPYFAVLLLTKIASSPNPIYRMNVTMLDGTQVNEDIPVPT